MSGHVQTRPDVVAITPERSRSVAEFLHRELNNRVSVSAWERVMDPPWGTPGPNSGFALVTGDEVVGAYLAVYSHRSIGGVETNVCNLAAFCVVEEHRAQSLRLLKAVLGQKGYLFTDLSPSGNVPAMNERLGFVHLDTSTRLLANLPRIGASRHRLIDDEGGIAARLRGADAQVYRDHRAAPAARHLVVEDDERYAYLVYRRDRRKRIRGFATPLFVGGDAALLEIAWRDVASYLLWRGLPATLAERRVLGFIPPGWGWDLTRPRPRMARPSRVGQALVDCLYSELTLLEW